MPTEGFDMFQTQYTCRPLVLNEIGCQSRDGKRWGPREGRGWESTSFTRGERRCENNGGGVGWLVKGGCRLRGARVGGERVRGKVRWNRESEIERDRETVGERGRGREARQVKARGGTAKEDNYKKGSGQEQGEIERMG